MKITENDIKEYLHQIKILLPFYKLPEKELLRELSDSIETYLGTHPDASTEDIEDHFGTPLEIVQGYVESLDIETLISNISVRKMLRRITIILLLVAIVGLSIFGGFYYKGYQYYKNTVVTENETTVDNN